MVWGFQLILPHCVSSLLHAWASHILHKIFFYWMGRMHECNVCVYSIWCLGRSSVCFFRIHSSLIWWYKLHSEWLTDDKTWIGMGMKKRHKHYGPISYAINMRLWDSKCIQCISLLWFLLHHHRHSFMYLFFIHSFTLATWWLVYVSSKVSNETSPKFLECLHMHLGIALVFSTCWDDKHCTESCYF